MNASPCRAAAARIAARSCDLPAYLSDLRPVRGKCKRRRCASRWGIVRVSLDFRDERVDRLAVLECAVCGRPWRRVTVPSLRSPAGYQAVRLTLILPGNLQRWRSRGHWHREGDDGLVVRDADLGDLDEAASAHQGRADRKADARARAAARKAEADSAALATTTDLLARLAARDAERAADEAAAAAREE